MTWWSIMGSTFYYLSLPIALIFNWLLAILRTTLTPLPHLGNSLISAFLLPLKVLAKFETLIIFLGSAVLIGLITGLILRRSAFSIRAARGEKKRNSNQDLLKWKVDPSVERRYSEWLEKDGGRKNDEHGLLAQTIIEEEDDSDDGF
ncbi:hypothetical protein DID88_000785 [Monilinia fructigena]|uniref:Uncharacterized protein n=1 Tax=Monilinia fructigena TaxID=38457 RepID=A0A395IIY1_9HELO|nr:hypothetical protein DID88_000785 [Monilinia fructigena]